MEIKRKRFSLIGLILSLILAIELFVTADLLLCGASSGLSPVFAAIIFFVVLAAALVLEAFSPKALSIVFLTVTALLLAAAIFVGVLLYKLYDSSYPTVDSDKSGLFANKRIMVIVPHEGDEQLIMGGVMEQYLDYSSQIWAVYATDEDLNYSLAYCGVDSSRIMQLQPDEDFNKELRELILRIRPDVIFCTDYGDGEEYEELSLRFEQVMGQVLKQKTGYHPTVFKTPIDSAYTENNDFYAENIVSTKYSGDTDYLPENNAYLWAQRVRLPVAATSISRSMFSSGSYSVLSLYGMDSSADSVINGDKVFWQRATDSISYDLEFWTSSGDAALLNDFVISDPDEVWIPEKDDTEKRIIIKFEDSTAIDHVVIYDNPSLTDNVLDIALRFDDGSFIMTGALEPNGSGTEIAVNKHYVSEMEIVLMDTEGSSAGLAELELYSESSPSSLSFLKIVNAQEDFVYDYYISSTGTEEFGIYAYGCSQNLEDYRVICIGDGCSAIADGDIIRVTCPEGQSCILTVMDKSGNISDSVQIRNQKTWSITLAQGVEQHIRGELLAGYENSNSWRIIHIFNSNTSKGKDT